MTIDQNQNLGGFLRQEREKRGITLEQIASATKINIKLLYFLEADQYSELPAKPFIRGFVVAYAKFIGLNSKEVLLHFNLYLEQKSFDRLIRDQGHSGYAFEKKESEQSRVVLWFIMGGFVLFGGVMILILKPTFHHHNTPSRIEKLRTLRAIVQSPAISTPSVLPSPSIAPSPSSTVTPSLKLKVIQDPLNSGSNLNTKEVKYKVLFKALVDVWVRYQVDDKAVMKFPLRKDRILVLKVQKEFRFQTSDPKGVSININSQGYKVLQLDPRVVFRQKNATLFIPSETAEKTQDPFPGEKPLPSNPPPSRIAAPLPTQ